MLMVNHPNRESYVPIDAIADTAAFRELNPVQAKFVTHYVGHGLVSGTYDALAAAQFALGNGKNHVKVRAYQMLRNKHIVAALNLHFHKSELEILLSDLQRAVTKSKRMGVGLTPKVIKALTAFEKYVTDRKSDKESAKVAPKGSDV